MSKTNWSLFKNQKVNGQKKENVGLEEDEFVFNYDNNVRLVVIGGKWTGKTKLVYEYIRRTIERDVELIRNQKEEKVHEISKIVKPIQYRDCQILKILKLLIAEKNEKKLLPLYQRLLHEENEFQRLFNLKNCRAKDEEQHILHHSEKLKKENELLVETEKKQKVALETSKKKVSHYRENLQRLEEKWMNKRDQKVQLRLDVKEKKEKIQLLDSKFESIGDVLRSHTKEETDEITEIKQMFTENPKKQNGIDVQHQNLDSVKYYSPVPSSNLMNALRQFNIKPKLGLEELSRLGLIDQDDPISVAVFLARCGCLNFTHVGELLGVKKNTALCEIYATYFMQKLFSSADFTCSLKAFFSLFQLPKEGQQVESIADIFSMKYCEYSEKPISTSGDAIFMFVSSILMTNSERPGQHRMNLQSFVETNVDIDPNYSSKVYTWLRNSPWLFQPRDVSSILVEESKYSHERPATRISSKGEDYIQTQQSIRRRASFRISHQRQKSRSMDLVNPDAPLFYIVREFSRSTIHYFQIRDTYSIEVDKSNEIIVTESLKRQIMQGDFFLCVYSATDRGSFSIIEAQINEICSLKQNGIDRILLVATKADSSKRFISTQEGKDLATKLKVPFIEISSVKPASQEQHVTHLFKTAFEFMIQPVSHRIQKYSVDTTMEKSRKFTDIESLASNVRYYIN